MTDSTKDHARRAARPPCSAMLPSPTHRMEPRWLAATTRRSTDENASLVDHARSDESDPARARLRRVLTTGSAATSSLTRASQSSGCAAGRQPSTVAGSASASPTLRGVRSARPTTRFSWESETERLPERRRAQLESDMRDVVRLHGDLPSIARYQASIDPVSDRELAELVVERALTLAGRHAGVLAHRWRGLHPDWAPVIDACLAALMLDESLVQDAAIGTSLGPLLDDGLGRYEIVEWLGSGSGGRTYEAVDRAVGGHGSEGRVAVKLIAIGEGRLEEMFAEAGLARRMTSESVARVLDAGVVDPRTARVLVASDRAVFIVHEFVDGLPLQVWKAAHPDATVKARTAVIGAIRRAMAACHAAGVSHGDLSPANVLVDAQGNARLVDFGRAEARSPSTTGPQPGSDDARLGELAEWLLSPTAPTIVQFPRMTSRWFAASAAIVVAAVSATWFLAGPFLERGGADEAPWAGTTPVVTPDGLPGDASRWLQSVLAEGPLAVDGEPGFPQQAIAWDSRARGQALAGAPTTELELCAAVSALACGDRVRATYHANQAIAASEAPGSEAKTSEADIARLVANLARFFAPGGEDAPPGYADSLEQHARRLGAPGLLRLPVLAERLAANKSAEEPRRFRSEGGGKVFDARSGMTIDIPGYDGK
ncbi:MAG: hypothetical protein FGM39_10285 [Phycisphaerales bacterium]|nr:hypothetical protein [Phycisphaerales bacterium]